MTRRIGSPCAGVVAASLLVVVCFAERAAAEIVFEEVVAYGDAIPGGGGATFGSFMGLPTLSNGTVIFSGGGAGAGGIYAYNGGTLTPLVDNQTAIPGGTGNFISGSATSTAGGTVVFEGLGSGSQRGIYTVSVTGGTVTRIADTSTPIPSGSGNFQVLVGPSINADGTIAFEGRGSNILDDGVYSVSADGGTITRIADGSTLMPGTANTFDGVDPPVIAPDGTVIFSGTSNTANVEAFQGIYSGTGGTLTTLVDSNTVIPGTTETFLTTTSPDMSEDGTIAFRGEGSDPAGPLGVRNTGVYTIAPDGTIATVADVNTADPDGSGNLLYFSPGNTPISGDSVAFLAYNLSESGTPVEGLYVSTNGTLQPILFVGDLLNGKQVTAILPGSESLEGNLLAFTVGFNDGTRAIYTATFDTVPVAVPEPSSLALLMLTGAGFGGTRWRRRRASLRAKP